jgi:hypothetical protein
VVQRVINSQLNEIVGGGRREAIPADMQPRDPHGAPYADDRYRHDDDRNDTDEHGFDDAHDTPPFGVGGAVPALAPGTPHFEIRDRLIELDDLRRRGILSEEEFAAKKSELLNRI